MPFQTEDRTDVWSIGEIDGVWGLNRDAPVTRGHRRNRECVTRHGVEHSNDLTDGVVTRRDGYLFTIGVGDHIGGIHIVEHCLKLIWFKKYIDGNEKWAFELAILIYCSIPLLYKSWISIE